MEFWRNPYECYDVIAYRKKRYVIISVNVTGGDIQLFTLNWLNFRSRMKHNFVPPSSFADGTHRTLGELNRSVKRPAKLLRPEYVKPYGKAVMASTMESLRIVRAK